MNNTYFCWSPNKNIKDINLLLLLLDHHNIRELIIKLSYIHNCVPKEKQYLIRNYLSFLSSMLKYTNSIKLEIANVSFVNYTTCLTNVLLDNYIPSTREVWEDLMLDIWNGNYFTMDLSYI